MTDPEKVYIGMTYLLYREYLIYLSPVHHVPCISYIYKVHHTTYHTTPFIFLHF